MTEQEYRLHPAVSRSDLWRLADSPEKLRHYREHPKPPTPALLFGQLLHKIILQPETFGEEFAVAPSADRRTKAGKEEWAEFVAYAEGRTIVTADMVSQASGIREALYRNKYVSVLLSGPKETPYFWLDEDTGEECKCRTDATVEVAGIPLVVDIKSVSDARTEPFARDAIRYGYHLQSAMYTTGVQSNTGREHGFVFILVEKEPPYAVNIVQASADFIQYGQDAYRHLITLYHDCKTTDNWWGYLGKNNEINQLYLPKWAK